MWTCTDDEPEWQSEKQLPTCDWAVFCCMCGGIAGVKFCPICSHSFCENCRGAYFKRGIEAVRTLVGRSRLHCGGGRHG